MKQIWMIIVLLGGTLHVAAQEDLRKEYEEFRRQQTQDFRDYVSRQNREFADFLKREWTLFQSMQADPVPSEPKPERVPFLPDRSLPSVPGPLVRPLPVGPVAPPPGPEKRPPTLPTLPEEVEVRFYGVPVRVDFSPRLGIAVGGTGEKEIAAYWERMSAVPYEDFIRSLLSCADELGVNDWGYYRLVETVAERVLTDANDRVAFVFYMLKQSGYDVRVGRGDDRLYLLMAFTTQLYGLPYFVLDGKKYYRPEGSEGALYTFGESEGMESGNALDLHQKRPLCIGGEEKVRELKLVKFPELRMVIPYNPAHADYYNDIPQTELEVYFSYPLPAATWRALHDVFGPLAEKHSLPELVAILLNFVQTLFDYKTDDGQFGREKYFYPEEVIAYPFCDCEDRSVFFACLVRNLTGAEVIGLDYPGHVATAVCFGDSEVPGDFFMFGGKRYVMCDPTYINASVGMTMPQFREVKPEVIAFRDIIH